MERGVLDTRDVLKGHLLLQIKQICTSSDLCDEIALCLIRKLSNEEIVKLLACPEELRRTIEETVQYISEKRKLGEIIFARVDETVPSYSEKITGMILELDFNTLNKLVHDDILLGKAIDKCKKTYYSHLQEIEYKDELGEKIYEQACRKYDSETASRITGMLLEQDTIQLEKLLSNITELQNKLHLAYEACSA